MSGVELFRRRSTPLGVLTVWLLLGACASVAPERGHDEVARLVHDRTKADTGWRNGPVTPEATHDRVAALLAGGLDARTAVAVALLNNPRVLATYERLGVSQADLVQAGLLRNPSFSIAAGWPVSGGKIVEQQFSLVQDFLDLFMLPLRREWAAEQFAADVATVAHEAYAVANEASQRLVDYQAAEQQVDLRRVFAEGARASAALAERQFAAGNITELALTSERALVAQAAIEVVSAEQRRVECREALNRVLGVFGPDTAWALAGTAVLEPVPGTALPPHLETRAMIERLDLAAARRQVRLFERALDLTRTWRWVGRLEIGVDTHQDPNGPRLLGPSLVIELPVFDQRQAALAKLEAQLRQAQHALDAIAVDARSHVRLAVAAVDAAARRVEQTQHGLVPLKSRVLELSQQQYNAMQIGLGALVLARQQQLDAQSAAVDALKDYWVARAQLNAAVGTDVSNSPGVTP